MKSLKYIAGVLAAFALTACSNDDSTDFSINTAEGVTVQLGETLMDVLENRGVFTVPVIVTGEPNGYVTITIECIEPTDGTAAIEGVNYYLTSNTINISPETKESYIELKTNDRRGLDPDRSFTLNIKEATGAQIGGARTCLVNLLDKGSSPMFNELAGRWYVNGLRLNDETGEVDAEFFDLATMSVVDQANMIVQMNVIGYPMQFRYIYDDEEKFGELAIKFGNEVGQGDGFVARWADGNSNIDTEMVGTWNSTYTSVTFGSFEDIIYLGAFKGNSMLGYLDIISGFTIARAQD